MVEVLPDDAPAPRLCHLIKWPDFDGYGFNLHAERSNPGQFIGKIDDESPAQTAGLREGDRIVEVNGVNIANENHRQVVERIKSNPLEARLLVVDQAADLWYQEKDLLVKSSQLNVIYMKTPVPRPRLASEPFEHGAATASTSDFNDDSLEQQVASGEPSVSRTPAPMSPDSGRGHDEADAQLGAGEQVAPAEQATRSELVVEAEINQQAPISELSKMHKQLVVEEVKQRLTKQQQESEATQPDSLASEHAATKAQRDEKEQARAKHNGSADSGKPTDSTRSSSSSNASLADSLEEHERQQQTTTTSATAKSNQVETESLDAGQEESATLHAQQKQQEKKSANNSEPTEAVEQTRPTPTSEQTKLSQLEGCTATKAPQTKQPLVAEPEQPPASQISNRPAEDKTTEIGGMTHATKAPFAAKSPVAPLQTNTHNNQMLQNNNNNNNYSSGLNLNMTASQMRELIASRKKFDPKKAQMNIRQKYEIIQQM